MGGVERCDVAESVFRAALGVAAEGCEAGRGPTMIGRITEAGMGGIGEPEMVVEDDGSADGVALAA
jgi:hypothetical protein